MKLTAPAEFLKILEKRDKRLEDSSPLVHGVILLSPRPSPTKYYYINYISHVSNLEYFRNPIFLLALRNYFFSFTQILNIFSLPISKQLKPPESTSSTLTSVSP